MGVFADCTARAKAREARDAGRVTAADVRAAYRAMHGRECSMPDSIILQCIDMAPHATAVRLAFVI